MRRRPLFWLGLFWLLSRFMRGGFFGPRYGFGGYRGYRHHGRHFL
jgi:hypothetical protein